MLEKRTPIQVDEAVRRVSLYKKGDTEWVALEDSLHRYLAEDVKADHDVPAFNRSPYDGFAIRASDSKRASRDNAVTFEVIDHIGAGAVSEKELGPYEAVRIMTGAQIPKGADAVVMLELTKTFSENGTNYMSVKRPFHAGDNISYQGEDAKKGSSLLKKDENHAGRNRSFSNLRLCFRSRGQKAGCRHYRNGNRASSCQRSA